MGQTAALVADKRAAQFLRLCLNSRREPASMDTARALSAQGQFDWDGVSKRAVSERIAPLIYQALRDQDFVPQAFIQLLRAEYDLTARRNLFLFNELAGIVGRLSSEGIQAIVLKGAALAHGVYGNIALRPLRDLDLLVHREAVAATVSALGEIGYKSPQVETTPGAMVEYESQMLLFKPEPLPIQVEVHWSLIDSPYYQHHQSLDWFWQSALPWRPVDSNALMLGPEAQTLYLCAHLALHHGGEGLLWLNDVAQVIYHYRAQLDWDQLIERASGDALVIPTQQTLNCVALEWAAPIPANALEEVRAMRASPEEARVSEWAAAKGGPPAKRLWADLLTMPGWRQRLAFGWTNLFPSTAYMRRRYRITNALLVFLYYPYRWWLGLYRALAHSSKSR